MDETTRQLFGLFRCEKNTPESSCKASSLLSGALSHSARHCSPRSSFHPSAQILIHVVGNTSEMFVHPKCSSSTLLHSQAINTRLDPLLAHATRAFRPPFSLLFRRSCFCNASPVSGPTLVASVLLLLIPRRLARRRRAQRGGKRVDFVFVLSRRDQFFPSFLPQLQFLLLGGITYSRPFRWTV